MARRGLGIVFLCKTLPGGSTPLRRPNDPKTSPETSCQTASISAWLESRPTLTNFLELGVDQPREPARERCPVGANRPDLDDEAADLLEAFSLNPRATIVCRMVSSMMVMIGSKSSRLFSTAPPVTAESTTLILFTMLRLKPGSERPTRWPGPCPGRWSERRSARHSPSDHRHVADDETALAGRHLLVRT
jgi:hypothetical protein